MEVKGYGRRTTTDYLRYLYIAQGSSCELETQVMLSNDLDYVTDEILESLRTDIVEVQKMLKSLIKSLENKQKE